MRFSCKLYFLFVPLQQRNNKTTKEMKLTNRIAIYVPSTYNGNKPARRLQKKACKHVAKHFCRIFGGSTATTANGYWYSDKLGLISENVTIIYANCTENDLQANTANVMQIAKAICKYMKQEAVSVEINNTLQFVEA